MPRLPVPPLLLAAGLFGGSAGCAAPKPPAESTASTLDSGGAAGGDSAPPQLNGVPPEAPVPAPEFAATNLDGSARSRADLLGHPTVMWFYPAAASAG
jgi:hypothetical protein